MLGGLRSGAGSAVHSPVEPQDPRAILTSVGAVVYRWDLIGDAIAWGSNAKDVFGVPDLALMSCGADWAALVDPDGGGGPAAIVSAPSGTDEGSGVPYATAYSLRLGSGRTLAVEDSGRWFADGEGRPVAVHGLIRVRAGDDAGPDSFARRRDEFLHRLGPDVHAAKNGRPGVTVLAFAIENLATLNEELGYEEADRAVHALVGRIRRVMRGRDRFVRYAGNRFALALRGCTADQAAGAVERLTRLVCAEPTERAPIELVIGGASAPDHALDAAGLLRRAEEALAVAKRRAGATFVLYDPKAFRAASRRIAGPSDLQCLELLNARRIALACQPVLESGTRALAFSEALLRIEDESGRIQVAADIVPALERSGLVPLADIRMLELVTDHLFAHPGERLSVNVSPMTLDNPDWLRALASHLGARAGVASRLIVEITETAAVRDPDATRRTLDAVKALGAAVAIDDFGAGHTSFRHLRAFPVDILKIDGVFVQNLRRSPSDSFFVRTLVDLAQHLGIATVAEWVEDEETACLLGSWGVEYLQGDHCGPPALATRQPQATRAA